MDTVQSFTETTAMALEVAGIAVITLGAVSSTIQAALGVARKKPADDVYGVYRKQLSQGILLGLEFLVAADIIRTVAISPTFASVGILGAIVIIRTFLSFTLEVEVTGRWPWSHAGHEARKSSIEQ